MKARHPGTALWQLVLTLAGGLLAGCGASTPGAEALDLGSAAQPESRERASEITLLAITDWHAQLDSMLTSIGPIGGAALLSGYLQSERRDHPDSLTLSAGDAFGGSPPLSSMFNDEPAVDVLEMLGLNVGVLGNHEFDRGLPYLRHLVERAHFTFLASNLDQLEAELPGVASPFRVVSVGGVQVGIIGIVGPVARTNLGSMVSADPVLAAANAREAAQQAGATVFVALVHSGVEKCDESYVCNGALISLAKRLSGFDVIVGGHSHHAGIWTKVGTQLIVQPSSLGQQYARITLAIDPATGGVAAPPEVTLVKTLGTAETPFAVDPTVGDYLEPLRAELAARMDPVIGQASAVLRPADGETAIGNLIADAMRVRYGTQLALVNSGGIRATLPSTYCPADKSLHRPQDGFINSPPYDLVIGDAYTALPFNNIVVTRTVTGRALWQALEHGVGKGGALFLQIAGLKLVASMSLPAGSRVTSVTLDDGTPIGKNDLEYTLALVDFVDQGSGGFYMFNDDAGAAHELLAEVVSDYIASGAVISSATDGRITLLP